MLNKTQNKIFLLGVIFLLQSCLVPINFSSVIVLDRGFNQIKALSKSELDAFEGHWHKFEAIEQLPSSLSTNLNHYKIDVVAEEKRFSGRWLYYPSGYIVKLNKKLNPAFKIQNSKEFNSTLGI